MEIVMKASKVMGKQMIFQVKAIVESLRSLEKYMVQQIKRVFRKHSSNMLARKIIFVHLKNEELMFTKIYEN